MEECAAQGLQKSIWRLSKTAVVKEEHFPDDDLKTSHKYACTPHQEKGALAQSASACKDSVPVFDQVYNDLPDAGEVT